MIKFSNMRLYIIIVAFLMLLMGSSESHAFWGALKKLDSTTTGKTVSKLGISKGVLSEEKIFELVAMIQDAGDIKKVGKVLGGMNLSNDVLEDTYMRIILKQNKITKAEGDELFVNLRGVHGLRSTLSKVAGVSSSKTSGHLNELRIANSAKKNGFDVVSIGEKFNDGSKLTTDIDILLKKNGKLFPIEAKHYSPNTNIPVDKFRADMDTLVAYRKKNSGSVIPVFTITNTPKNRNVKKLLEKESQRRRIELIFGSPEEQIFLIDQLAKIR